MNLPPILIDSLTPRNMVLASFAAAGAYVHLRGRERLRVGRQLLDHSTLMAPYNALVYLLSAVKAKPYVDLRQFPQLDVLRQNWRVIRDEALQLSGGGHIRAATGYNDLGFNSFFRHGWKRFYLKWYDEPLPSAAALCPKTTALVSDLPGVSAAMFALLPAGSRLGRHRDPFAGSLRYHLGLSTPNSDRCRIIVDGDVYAWRDGEAVMFDETYVHHAANETGTDRLILFCDIERPLLSPVARFVNRVVARTLVRAAATQNLPGEHVGVLNRLFGCVYRVRLAGLKLKDWHKPTYYAVKWVLVMGALGWMLR